VGGGTGPIGRKFWPGASKSSEGHRDKKVLKVGNDDTGRGSFQGLVLSAGDVTPCVHSIHKPGGGDMDHEGTARKWESENGIRP